MICLQPFSSAGLQYNHVIGTGGIGSGMLFAMSGDHTLGRNESRMATLLPAKDFCKQHIIMHYLAVLLGSEIDGKFECLPIGSVGNDDVGKDLIKNMKATGMNTKHV